MVNSTVVEWLNKGLMVNSTVVEWLNKGLMVDSTVVEWLNKGFTRLWLMRVRKRVWLSGEGGPGGGVLCCKVSVVVVEYYYFVLSFTGPPVPITARVRSTPRQNSSFVFTVPSGAQAADGRAAHGAAGGLGGGGQQGAGRCV
eukprot:1195840-Prorocentrum_minimum.AAC.5